MAVPTFGQSDSLPHFGTGAPPQWYQCSFISFLLSVYVSNIGGLFVAIKVPGTFSTDKISDCWCAKANVCSNMRCSKYFPLSVTEFVRSWYNCIAGFSTISLQFSYDIQFTVEYCFWSILICKEIRISFCQGGDLQCLYSLQHSYSLYAKTSHYQIHTKKQSNKYLISSCLHIKKFTVNHQQILF